MDTPKVSVLMPTFNRESFITDAVRSVLAQDYGNTELVIVDDGSTDRTAEILVEQFSDYMTGVPVDGKTICYYPAEHQGISGARNLALDKAAGDYIAFLDSDDRFHPNKLRLQMEYLFTHRWWTADKKEFTRVHLDILEGLYADVRRQVAQSRLVLQELRERCPLVLVSNFYGNMGSVLFEMSLDGLFSHVVESAVVGFRKPDPRLFQLAIDAFSQTETTALAPDEIMVVGDSLRKDIEPARSLGCQTTWLKGEGWSDEPADESLPTHVITELQQLLKL